MSTVNVVIAPPAGRGVEYVEAEAQYLAQWLGPRVPLRAVHFDGRVGKGLIKTTTVNCQRTTRHASIGIARQSLDTCD